MDSFLHKHQSALDSQREQSAIDWRFGDPIEDEPIEDKDYPNFIEWGKTNNTLLDLITNNWLGDKTNFFMCKDKSVWNPRPLGVFCKFDGKHPSKLSHQIIAKKLLKYMGDYND